VETGHLRKRASEEATLRREFPTRNRKVRGNNSIQTERFEYKQVTLHKRLQRSSSKKRKRKQARINSKEIYSPKEVVTQRGRPEERDGNKAKN